jgi:hypothetical protein
MLSLRRGGRVGEPEKEIHPVNEFPGKRRVRDDETGSLNKAGTAEFSDQG